MKTTLHLFITTHLYTLLGVLVGLSGGFAYWYFIGCVSGTCPITSNPFISTLYGGLMGGLLLNSFESKKEKKQDDER